jgi:hypothetical protein
VGLLSGWIGRRWLTDTLCTLGVISVGQVVLPSGILGEGHCAVVSLRYHFSMAAGDGGSGDVEVSGGSLASIKTELGVSDTELGGLFDIDATEASRWLSAGVPTERVGDVELVALVVAEYTSRLKPGRLAVVARRPAADFGGGTLLDVLAGDPGGVLAIVRETFRYSALV